MGKVTVIYLECEGPDALGEVRQTLDALLRREDRPVAVAGAALGTRFKKVQG
jgi:hypothetical protein